jgi:hypothetical protein
MWGSLHADENVVLIDSRAAGSKEDNYRKW